uniref:Uncharacterized protein n=1 Tax=Kalanchoe fedtschenkoi TaxID=63787 RepID=A0A7N0UP11_KALFE
MATNIGMMDSAYFVGRNEILAWINARLRLQLSRIEEAGLTGVVSSLLSVCFSVISNTKWEKVIDSSSILDLDRKVRNANLPHLDVTVQTAAAMHSIALVCPAEGGCY